MLDKNGEEIELREEDEDDFSKLVRENAYADDEDFRGAGYQFVDEDGEPVEEMSDDEDSYDDIGLDEDFGTDEDLD